MGRIAIKHISCLLLGALLLLQDGWAQQYGTRLGTVKRGGKVSFEPSGSGVLFNALDPVVRKWYVPQELYAEYGWRQWEYSNYARSNYQSYVNTSIEGDYYYDVYGNFLTRGWLIFDWRQQNPQPFGSTLFKDGRFAGWFNNLLVASDHKGQYHYAVTVGNEIRTTLTPMTFSKPVFNGIQLDWASDKYRATLLLSRISEPDFSSGGLVEFRGARSDNTNFFGGRLEAQVGDFIKVGGTLANAHHVQTQNEAFSGSIFKGNLTGVQNLGNVSLIEVLIKDDSPADDEAGGALFASDILITDLDGAQTRGSEIGFRPAIEGGFQRRGFLAADGTEIITLSFDFFDRSYTGPDPSEIRAIRLEFVLANDYLVEVSSDRQIDARTRKIFLPMARATGNVKDGSNQRVLAFDYGLPTANQITGFTLELTDLEGIDGYMEVDINQRYRRFPNPNVEQHHSANARSEAWIGNLSKVSYPYFAYLEAFDVDPGYSTGLAVVDQFGTVDYASNNRRYEFVDDNDDQDRTADWSRLGTTGTDREVFPGWDENNDFISDFNQNDSPDSPNLLPDYDEPFLRFYTDRPEFLYGVDMNHNGVIDRFENDEAADYPYRVDRRGYNVYGGVHITPALRLMAGRQDVRQISDDRRNRAAYLLLTADRSGSGWGRLRLFQDVRKVRDTIQDDLLQWIQVPNSPGELRPVRDILPARDTWINTTWLGLDYEGIPGLLTRHTVKWQLYHQREGDLALALRGVRQQASFLGLVNKAEYRLQWWNATLVPAWKSEFRRQTPVLSREARQRELSELFFLMGRLPVMRNSYIQTGVEYHIFNQLRDPTPPGAEDDFTELTTVFQLTNTSDYQGYRLTTVLGFDSTRRNLEVEGTRTRTRGFLTVYAGVEL